MMYSLLMFVFFSPMYLILPEDGFLSRKMYKVVCQEIIQCMFVEYMCISWNYMNSKQKQTRVFKCRLLKPIC